MSSGWGRRRRRGSRGPADFTPSSPEYAFREARAMLAGKRMRRLPGTKTDLRAGFDDQTVHVRYHQTNVVTYHEDGRIELYHGGWHTHATGQKIEAYCPWVYAYNLQSHLHIGRRRVHVDPLVEEAALAIEEAGAEPRVDDNQPSLAFKSDGRHIVLWPDGLLAYDDETRTEALARIDAWRNEPAPQPRRFTARNPNPDQLTLFVAA